MNEAKRVALEKTRMLRELADDSRPTTLVTDEVELLKRVYLAGHSEGWTGNQQRRDVQHVDAEKGWSLYVENGALDKAVARAAIEAMPTVVTGELQSESVGDHALPCSASSPVSRSRPKAAAAIARKGA